jgi:hypothetical protein
MHYNWYCSWGLNEWTQRAYPSNIGALDRRPILWVGLLQVGGRHWNALSEEMTYEEWTQC